MKKYLVISFCIHVLFFLSIYHYPKPGQENIQINKVISVSFVVDKVKPSENPGSPNVAEKILEKKENSVNEKQKEKTKKEKSKEEKPKVEKPKEEKPKPEKPKKEESVEKSFESKVADPDAKSKKEDAVSTADTGKSSDDSDVGKDTGTESSEKGTGDSGNPFYGSNFQANGDGSYTALSSEGIQYEIIKEVQPDYPSQAEAISYENVVKVKVKFLVGLKGNVENIQIIQSHKKLGFDNEVMKAVKKWRFKPIYYAGKNIKVYFVKEFIFNPR